MIVIITGLFFLLTLVAGISHSETTIYRLHADQTAAFAREPVAIENDQRGFKIIIAPCITQGNILVADCLLAAGIARFSQNRSPKFKLHQILRI